MAAKCRALAVTKLAELQQLFPHGRDVCVICTKRVAERDHNPVRNRFGQLREKAAALEREDRAPELIEPYRDDRRFRLARDDFVSAPQTQERSRPREFAFRKKTNDFAGLNPRHCAAHRILRFARRDRNAADGAQNRIEKPVPIDTFIDDESNRPRAGEQKHDRVYPGDMVWEEKKSAFRQSFEAHRRDAINKPRKAEAEKSQHAFEAGRVGHCLWFTRSGLFRAIVNSMTPNDSRAKAAARVALGLLLGINLFNYIDRFVLAAVEPNIRAAFFAPGDVNAMA